MTSVVDRLLEVYRRQLELYAEVLRLTEREGEALRRRRPLAEIIDSLRRKRDLLRRIEAMDRAAAGDKGAYRRAAASDPERVAVLGETLAAVRRMIQRIMEAEAGNERAILEVGGAAAGPPPVEGVSRVENHGHAG